MSQQNPSNDHAGATSNERIQESLKNELDLYSKKGISLSIRGRYARPVDIAFVCKVCESSTPYMRDYITDENGIVRMIDFVRVEK